jgi:hypothetical protein
MVLSGACPLVTGFAIADAAEVTQNAETMSPESQSETIRLLIDQVKQLKDRVQQLEKIVGDKNANALNTPAIPAPPIAHPPVENPPPPNAPPQSVAEKLYNDQLQIGHTNLSFGGFIEGSMTWRQHNEFAAASNTNFGTPFPNAVNYNDQELQADARSTRIQVNTVSNLHDNTQLTSRLEFDWQGVPASATQNNNGYSTRLRHAFLEADSFDSGWHLIFGQSYSLTTPYGNLVRADGSASADVAWSLRPNLPIIALDPLDDIGPAGVDAPRQMQIRIIKDIAANAAIAISLENPLVVWGANQGGPTPVYTGTTLLPGSNAQYNNNASQPLGLGTRPDVILKFGYDPNPNIHLEGFGIIRNYKDLAGTSGLTDTGSVTAGGASFDTYIKTIPGKFDVNLGIGYGSLGGYAGDGIADVSYTATGKPVAINESQAWFGLIGHPNHDLDLFAYAGMERANAGAVSGTQYGYGNPNYLNGGCNVLAGACNGNTRLVWDAELGAIWRFYNGSYGHMDFMPQISYLRRTLFTDISGNAPSASNLALDLTFRLYPF